MPHRGVLRLVVDIEYVRILRDDNFLQFSPVSFDASTFEIWAPLLNGAKLVLTPPDVSSIQDLREILRQENITILWLTAGLFHQLVDHGLEGLDSLRYLLAGGDVLSVAHVNKAITAAPRMKIINGYGPTENTTFSCCFMVDRSIVSTTVPIGLPIHGTTIYILDERQQAVDDDEDGELYLAGDGLALGYLNNPSITAESFIPDPFSDMPGARMYRTGDIVKRNETGHLEFLGRRDAQVKIRGFRVELGEVEAALRALDEVQDCCVLMSNEKSTAPRLCAVYVCEKILLTADLRRRLLAYLPDYMIPAIFIRRDELPLTTNGKVDRHLLIQNSVQNRIGLTTEYKPPANKLEDWLVQLWAQVLGLSILGIMDDFFELGGNSLVATGITSEIFRTHGTRIPIYRFYEEPTVAGLAKADQ